MVPMCGHAVREGGGSYGAHLVQLVMVSASNGLQGHRVSINAESNVNCNLCSKLSLPESAL